MKRLSKSKKMSALLGVSLLVLGACAPDSLTRGGAAQPAPIERSTDGGTAANVNEAANTNAASNANAVNANEASNANEANVQAAPSVSALAQPADASALGATLASPLPTPTMQSTPRAQGEIEFTGAVEVIASDMWVVGGRTVAVTAATEIKPGLTIGTLAKVHAMPQANGTLWAREIEPAGRTDNSNSNGNDNDNSNGNVNGNANSNSNANSNANSNSNGNVNSNDDNGNDDHGGSNNANDDNGNDDHGSNGNDDRGGNGNDDHGGNSNDD